MDEAAAFHVPLGTNVGVTLLPYYDNNSCEEHKT